MIALAIATHSLQMYRLGPTINLRPAASFETWSSVFRQKEHLSLRIRMVCSRLFQSFAPERQPSAAAAGRSNARMDAMVRTSFDSSIASSGGP
jgi:hypothetical protein